MAIIEINEVHTVWYDIDDDPQTISSETFIIDTDKVDEMLAQDEHAFHYTKFIINDARNFLTDITASVKYSFTDTSDEYEKCKADDDAVVDHVMRVELNY